MNPVKRRPQALRFLTLLFCILASNLISTQPQAAPAQEDQVKAAILYKLSRFIQWPAQARTETFTLCMLGKDALNDYVAPLKGRKSMSQTIDVVMLTRFDITEKRCNLLFINQGEKSQLKPVLDSLEGTHILTVSDIKGFAKNGGMVELVRDSQRVSFMLNIPVTRKEGFVISSQLIKIARAIR